MRNSNRKPLTRKKFIIISAVISALIIAIPFACDERLSETYYSVTSDKLSGQVKLAFISDVHNTPYGRNMSGIVDSVAEFAPDAVIFGGDLFDDVWGEPNSVLLVKRLTELYPCFYSLGNHEFHEGDTGADTVRKEMTALGVHVLDGKYFDLDTAGGTVRIHGIDGTSSGDQLRSCVNALTDDTPNILVNHYPEEFPVLSAKGFDLILSGHAHGGQIRLPPLINGLFSPGEGFFPKFTSGEYFDKGSEMIVSRGLQRSVRDFLIPRVFNRPEIVYITLEP